jgi:putative endonuclease
MFTVYILYSNSADRYYIGHTINLANRIENHNRERGKGKYTRKNGPWKVVYTENFFKTRSEAMQSERQIKGWKSRKRIEDLIRVSVGRVPHERD